MKRIVALWIIFALLLPCAALGESLDCEAGALETELTETGDSAAWEEDLPAQIASNAPVQLKVRDSASLSATLGKTYQLVVPRKTIQACKSSNSKVAKVTDKGLLKPVKAGKVTITVKLKEGGKLRATLAVKKAPKELKKYFNMRLKTAAKKIGGLKAYTERFEIYKYYGYKNKRVSIQCFGKPNGKVDTIRLRSPSNYSLFGVQVGMKKAAAQAKMRKRQLEWQHDDGECYWIKKLGPGAGSILEIYYKNGKVCSVVYEWYGN